MSLVAVAVILTFFHCIYDYRSSFAQYAYRLTEVLPSGNADSKQNTILKHDNNDDGENAAGSKLAYLLELRKEDGVLVVVTRWYGGIPLGPKRFHHIVNCARELLDYAHRQGILFKGASTRD